MINRIWLDVPFSQKDAVKKLGAWWSSASKQWYVPPHASAAPFTRWIPVNVTAGSPKRFQKRMAATGVAPKRYTPAASSHLQEPKATRSTARKRRKARRHPHDATVAQLDKSARNHMHNL